jgi:hypothetical protein
MISHIRLIRTIWIISAVSAMTAALVGIFDPSIYEGLVPMHIIPGAGILSPLALAELIKPRRYGLPTNSGELWLYLILSLVFLIVTGVYFVFLKQSDHE